jgi:hypothetical protein
MEPEPPSRPGAGGPEMGRPSDSSQDPLVAVVWTRQVDNEAESPGYTTRPADFSGRRQTLERVKFVGNLAINGCDTHDYWDPDPTTKLAFYNNLFLYPAYAGRYLCLGRMFLSTEDRPRLGMKTLVLKARDFLSRSDAGSAVRKWYLSMGPVPRGAASVASDPELQAQLVTAFGFSSDTVQAPRYLLVSQRWNALMESLLSLLESLPASLVALSAILAFPYYLPVSAVNLNDFTGTFPLTLGISRVPPSEATGERHEKRISSWTAAGLRVIDLTTDLGVGLGRAPPLKGPIPAVTYSLSSREAIDRVEIPRYLGNLSEPEFLRGPARRGELKRIASAVMAVHRVTSTDPDERPALDSHILRAAEPYTDVETASPAPSAPPLRASRRSAAAAAPKAEPEPRSAAERDLDRLVSERGEPLSDRPPSRGVLEETEHWERQMVADLLQRVDAEVDRRLASKLEQLIGPAFLDARITEALGRLSPEVLRPSPPSREDLAPLVREILSSQVNAMLEAPEEGNAMIRMVDGRITRTLLRSLERQREVAEEKFRQLASDIELRRAEMEGLDASLREQLDVIDTKVRVLTERVVPLLRRTLERVGEVQEAVRSGSPDAKIAKVREEFRREIQRIEEQVVGPMREVLDRVEASLQNQDQVWSTLTEQIAALNNERRDILEQVRRGREGLLPTKAQPET